MAGKHRAHDEEERRRSLSDRRRFLVLLGSLILVAAVVSVVWNVTPRPFAALGLPLGLALFWLAARLTLD